MGRRRDPSKPPSADEFALASGTSVAFELGATHVALLSPCVLPVHSRRRPSRRLPRRGAHGPRGGGARLRVGAAASSAARRRGDTGAAGPRLRVDRGLPPLDGAPLRLGPGPLRAGAARARPLGGATLGGAG